MSDIEKGPEGYRARCIGVVCELGDPAEDKSVSWVDFLSVAVGQVPVSTQDLVDAGVTAPVPDYYDDKTKYILAEVNLDAQQISEVKPAVIEAMVTLSAEEYAAARRAWDSGEL